jgi:diadenosine tetraphosphatase ApaH/serine/threonine PP2A family protein phosphatase
MNPEKIYDNTPLPYDIIGDVHGCIEELTELFRKLGYEKTGNLFTHLDNRTPVFLGDLTDRGPGSIAVLNLVITMVKQKKALFIPGNHDIKLKKWFEGRNIQVKHGMETTVSELMKLSQEERVKLGEYFSAMLDDSPPYLILDKGNLIVTHGGMKEKYIGQFNKRIQSLILFGDTTGRTDEQGLPERKDWAVDYSGKALIVYGHTPVDNPHIRNNTINIDGGCVFGGKLCAFRYPEKEVAWVNAKKQYYTREK